MNVLSLFDGLSCGQIALQRAGIKVDNYYASEIKDIAIKTTQHHFPNTIQLGDITKIDGTKLPKIDLLIGGSPCQNFSIANLNYRSGLNGIKSGLFYHYLRLLKEVKPKYFLLENVVMKKDQEDLITSLLGGGQPIKINSSLVSAQNRPRLYWTNIPNVSIPTDKGIKLNSILDNGWCPKEKARCLLVSDSRPLRTPVKMFHRFLLGFTTLIFKDQKHYEECRDHYNANFKGKAAKDIIYNGSVYDGVRYLNKTERERLQTMPEGYCDLLTENEAANTLGDGWTVNVIAHIFQNIVI